MDWVMNATIGQLIGGGFGIVAFILMFIEFTPIKVNPISAILGWVGQRTNKELNGRLTTMESTVEEISLRQKDIEEKAQEREAINARIRILRFSDEIRRGLKHSQESLDQALSDVTTYEHYCDDHPKFENQKAVGACEHIKKEHARCLAENDFL